MHENGFRFLPNIIHKNELKVDYRLNIKVKTKKFSEVSSINSLWSWVRQWFLRNYIKSISCALWQLKTFVFQRTPWRKWKDNQQSERKICKSYNWFWNLEYTKDASNSMRQAAQLKNGQRIWIVSAPKIYECWICTWKDIQNY